MPKPVFKYSLWSITLVVILACAVPAVQPPPPAPTLDGNAINTMIVQTGNAAVTQTMAALPTHTSTVTFTPTPRFTDTPEPTATATIIFRFFSPTPIGQNLTETSNKAYACQLISAFPQGKVFAPRKDFDAKWKVKNIGTHEWTKNEVDYLYLSGDKFHAVEGYDLSKTVKLGEIIELVAYMVAPKNPGTYTTNWTLQAGSQKFCTMTLTIVVQE